MKKIQTLRQAVLAFAVLSFSGFGMACYEPTTDIEIEYDDTLPSGPKLWNSDGVYFQRLGENYAVVHDSSSIYGGTSTVSGHLEIPGTFDGRPVVAIWNFAFRHFLRPSKIISVTIPNSVTYIGDYAFNGNALTSVIIPDSVTSIEERAFYSNKLSSAIIHDRVTSIGDWAFYDNSLTSVTIPESVTSIGYAAFSNNSLTSITIPESVTSIGRHAFQQNKLATVTIPNNITIIENNVFSNNNLTDVSIPDSVTRIGSFAFASNKLNTIDIGNSVTSIWGAAFYDNNLTTVTIPDSLTDISGSVFADNPNLESIHVSEGNQTYTSEDGVLYNKEMTTLVAFPEGKSPVSIPAGITRIGYGAFMSNSLTAIIIPDSVSSIEPIAFLECNLTSITIPEGVTIESGSSMGMYGGTFQTLYNNNGRQAGTYIFAEGKWTRH